MLVAGRRDSLEVIGVGPLSAAARCKTVAISSADMPRWIISILSVASMSSSWSRRK